MTAESAANPFLSEWTTPFQTPPFDEIKEAHYRPAFEEGMAAQKKEIEAVAASAEPPTFANTIEALERSGALLTKVGERLLRPDQQQHQRRDAEDRGGDGPDPVQAPGRHRPQRQALRAGQSRLGPAGQARPRPRAGPPARKDLQSLRPERRRPRRGRKKPSSARSTRSWPS